ncbi:EAL domain-containing protein [Arabiibacter massiliensis]|uniref:EAL domain-containing protein n=1 Tax=Arabiibacter massiliensis TaxID=1870985 RepID=UPI00117A84E1|nr:EAL domain-containing protein [Arabiibacter massiliensis]
MSAPERDALTGLANRQGFNRAVRRLIDENPQERFVILYGDIDRFKVFNDRFGAEAGDRLLAAVASQIASLLPEHAVAARLRADHFAACLPSSQCDPERTLRQLDAWFGTYPADFAFFIRLGVYEVDDPGLDVSLMTDRALLALRAAKTGAKDSKCARFDESLRDSVVKEQEMAGEMADALASGQFELHFQPQYRYTTGELVGAEALARWNHPQKGLIGPAEFIPVFERTGLISEFDYHMWAEACRCLRAWLDEAGPDGAARVPRLSVNLSRADIYRDDLCDYLEGLVREHDLPIDLLHLEITESAYVEAPEQLAEAVRRLQGAGFTVEMDDFGSGYSSLNVLKDVPVDVLKLDLRFLDARNDTRGGIILASVVRMARWLELPVIAEGVESESQAAYLASIGCDVMQGYWFSKPVDRASFEEVMRASRLGGVEDGRRWHAVRREGGEEAAQLWDADSVIALVFNSYVGPAALAEFDGSSFEVVRANDDFHRLLALPLDRFAHTQEEVFGALAEDDAESLQEALGRAAVDAVGECELCVRGRGDDFWVHVSARLLTQQGSVSSLLLLLDETTETKALRDRLRAAMDGVPGGLCFYRLEGERIAMLDFNDAAAELAGYGREEFQKACGEDPLAPVAAGDRWIVEAVVGELRDGAKRAEGTLRIACQGGVERWCSMSASVMHRSGGVLYVVAVFLDVTKDKERDLQFKARAEQQHQLFDTLPCCIVRYTVDDEPRMVSANQEACHVMACSFEEVLSLTKDDVFAPLSPEGHEQLHGILRRLRAGSGPLPFSCQLRRADGELRWVEGVSALTVTMDGQTIVQSAFNDVTETRRQRSETELKRFTAVLCGVFDEVFEVNVEQGTYLLKHSMHQSPEDARPVPIEEALALWFEHIPSQKDRDRVGGIVRGFREKLPDEPITCTYRFVVEGRELWYESTFLRASDTSVLCCNNDVTARTLAEDARLERRVGDIVANLPAGIGVYDLDEEGAHPRYVSDAVCDLVGKSRAEYDVLIAANATVHDSQAVQRFLAQRASDEGAQDFVLERTMLRDGQQAVVRVQSRVAPLERGGLRVYAVITDVTEEVRERRRQSWQTERYRLLSELTHAISFDYDSESDTVLLYIDRTGKGMEAQVIPHYVETLSDARASTVHPESMETVRAMFERVREGTTNEIIEYRADYYGTGYQWYRTNLFVAHDEGGAWHLVGLIENIQTERELRLKAEVDGVTGLSNYAAAHDLVSNALADPHVRSHSVCAVVDLDDFKAVNDTFGHLKGDELLAAVGRVLRSSCRESDVVGRVGGDEFVVLLKNIGLEVAVRKLAAMKRSVAALFDGDAADAGLHPTISIGAAPTRASDEGYEDVFSRADQALYEAKHAGKNRLRVAR